MGGSFTDVSTDVAGGSLLPLYRDDPPQPGVRRLPGRHPSSAPTNPTACAQEMAVFLLKASQGSELHTPGLRRHLLGCPVYTPGAGFPDWIENLYHRGITAGCQLPGDPLAHCPTRDVLRSEMAVFLLKSSRGSSYAPPACAGIFSDVPCTPGVGFADWIEDIYNRGITSGCQATGVPLGVTARTQTFSARRWRSFS